MKFQIIKLSNDLLQANAFNHLTDKDLEALKKAMQLMSLEYLIQAWYKADYFCSWKAEQLMMPCNQSFIHYGLPYTKLLSRKRIGFLIRPILYGYISSALNAATSCFYIS